MIDKVRFRDIFRKGILVGSEYSDSFRRRLRWHLGRSDLAQKLGQVRNVLCVKDVVSRAQLWCSV